MTRLRPFSSPFRSCLLLSLALLTIPATALSEGTPPTPVHPFAVGERYTYRVSWFGIHAATAVMEVGDSPPLHGRHALRLLTTAVSSPAVTKLYPVDNRVESFVDADTLVPYRLLFRRREGKRKNDYDISLQHAEGKVAGTKDGEAYTVPIPAGTQDSISCLYAVRNVSSLQPGFSQVMTVHHDKKNYRLRSRSRRLKKSAGPGGRSKRFARWPSCPFRGFF